MSIEEAKVRVIKELLDALKLNTLALNSNTLALNNSTQKTNNTVSKVKNQELVKKEKTNKNHQLGWRSDPATKVQKNYLFKNKITFQSDITKGEASDLIKHNKETKGAYIS
ncbi:MAG: hypothetical protein ACTSW1_17570 [Candidatus Hodarchaeales archaeon]